MSYFKQVMHKIIRVIFAAMILCAGSNIYAQDRVGIVIPELREPFKSIFEAVGEGVDLYRPGNSSQFLLTKSHKPEDITQWVQKEKLGSVIALGVSGRKATAHLPSSMPVVLGALLAKPGAGNIRPGIALTPDPISLFKLLQQISSKHTKVIVVYNPSRNQWIIDLALKQMDDNELQLSSLVAIDLKQAIKMYDKVLSKSNPEDTALWLLPDPSIIDSKVVLPFILKKSWENNFIVFSSALAHVKKGVLFSMFPDNVAHGQQLAELVAKQMRSGLENKNVIYPTSGLQKALNSRVAEHIGLNLSRSQVRDFDVVFPVSN